VTACVCCTLPVLQASLRSLSQADRRRPRGVLQLQAGVCVRACALVSQWLRPAACATGIPSAVVVLLLMVDAVDAATLRRSGLTCGARTWRTVRPCSSTSACSGCATCASTRSRLRTRGFRVDAAGRTSSRRSTCCPTSRCVAACAQSTTNDGIARVCVLVCVCVCVRVRVCVCVTAGATAVRADRALGAEGSMRHHDGPYSGGHVRVRVPRRSRGLQGGAAARGRVCEDEAGLVHVLLQPVQHAHVVRSCHCHCHCHCHSLTLSLSHSLTLSLTLTLSLSPLCLCL
jgi:hypothetical protein